MKVNFSLKLIRIRNIRFDCGKRSLDKYRYVMDLPLPSFNKNTSIDLIEKILQDILAILNTGDKGKLVGIITRSDILEQFSY